MKVSIESDKVRIESSGIEFLRIKSEVARRLGSVAESGRSFVRFPLATLHLVQDLLDARAEGCETLAPAMALMDQHTLARTSALRRIETTSDEEIPERWRQILDPPQSAAVSAMIVSELLGLCLFDEQGSGKTVMTIAAFDILKEKGLIDALIVICPKSMVSEWPKDIEKFLNSKYKVLQAEGSKRQKYEAATKDFDILVTNYEGLEPMLTSLLAFAEQTNYLLVVDESYYLKNADSNRSEKAMKLRIRCKRCFVLCGTPAPNSAHDLVHQFNLADLGYTFGGFHQSKYPIRDWERISQLIEERGLFIRRLKSEILQQVPEKNFHVISINLEGKQEKMYENARQALELELRTFTNEKFKRSLATYFQRRSVLLQICCCPDALDPTLSETPAKYTVLDKLLADLISKGRKVVIWSFFTQSINDLMSRYTKYKPVRVDGSIPGSLRREAVRLFQEDPDVKLFVGNPAAAGAGITLHASFDAVYLSYSNQAAHYLQSLDRIHRRGQISDHVNYYLFVCKGTIEETEIVRLRGKEIRQNGLLGDHIPWPTSLDDALNELSADD